MEPFERELDFGAAFGNAFKFGITGFLPLLRLGWLPILLMSVGAVLQFAGVVPLAAAEGIGGSPEALAAGMSATVPLMLVGMLLLLAGMVLFVSVYVGLVRRAAGLPPERRGLGGLAFGGPEFRVVGATILYVLVMLLAGGLLVGAVTAVTAAADATGLGGWAALVLVLGGLAGGLATFWIGVRLSLVAALAAAENRLSLGEAWRTTKGHFWIMVGLYLVVGIAVAVIGQVVQTVALTLGVAPLAASGVFEAEDPSILLSGAMLPLLIGLGVALLVTALFQQLVSIGLSGTMLRQLRGYEDDDEAAAFA